MEKALHNTIPGDRDVIDLPGVVRRVSTERILATPHPSASQHNYSTNYTHSPGRTRFQSPFRTFLKSKTLFLKIEMHKYTKTAHCSFQLMSTK